MTPTTSIHLSLLEQQQGPSQRLLAGLDPRAFSNNLRGAFGTLEFTFACPHHNANCDIRPFMRKLRRHWPYAAYFCPPDSQFFLLHVLGQVRRGTRLHSPHQPSPLWQPDTLQTAIVIESLLDSMITLGRRAGMSQFELMHREVEFLARLTRWTH